MFVFSDRGNRPILLYHKKLYEFQNSLLYCSPPLPRPKIGLLTFARTRMQCKSTSSHGGLQEGAWLCIAVLLGNVVRRHWSFDTISKTSFVQKSPPARPATAPWSSAPSAARSTNAPAPVQQLEEEWSWGIRWNAATARRCVSTRHN